MLILTGYRLMVTINNDYQPPRPVNFPKVVNDHNPILFTTHPDRGTSDNVMECRSYYARLPGSPICQVINMENFHLFHTPAKIYQVCLFILHEIKSPGFPVSLPPMMLASILNTRAHILTDASCCAKDTCLQNLWTSTLDWKTRGCKARNHRSITRIDWSTDRIV